MHVFLIVAIPVIALVLAVAGQLLSALLVGTPDQPGVFYPLTGEHHRRGGRSPMVRGDFDCCTIRGHRCASGLIR